MRSKAHDTRAKYCSDACRQAAWKSKNVGKDAPNYRNGQRIKDKQKICEICGKAYLIDEAHEKNSHCCGENCMRRWRSLHFRNENASNWKGGISGERERDMQRLEYVTWRKTVFERDHYTCQLCGDSHGGNLQAHHICSYKDYPTLRYTVENGITLCEKCHRKVHKNKIDIQSEPRK